MSIGWDGLPLLAIRCILEHLSVDDALAALSTCRHWRSAMLLYEGHRDTLKLKAKQLEKNLFLIRLFRKHTRILHVYIDCSDEELNKFMNFVLPQFFDSIKLEEVVFIGPIYMQQNPLLPYAKIKRIILESLVYKHSKFIQKLAIIGCEMGVKNENDRYVHKQVEYFSKPLSFNCVTSPSDAVLSRCNIDVMKLSNLKHIMFEYELISTESLETLSHLNNLKFLSLNIGFKKKSELNPIDWHRVNNCFTRGLDVGVNLISVPPKRFKSIIDKVLVDGMPLTSFKVMFCKTFFCRLIAHLSRVYRMTLRELVWVDAPHLGLEQTRLIRFQYGGLVYQVNPFILLCWQCENLQRLVVHGYWIWHYDLIGFIRLRQSLRIEISSIYGKRETFPARLQQPAECVLRVLAHDLPPMIDPKYIQEVNEYADYEWKPIPWHRLHAGLRLQSNSDRRGDYIVKELLNTLGVT